MARSTALRTKVVLVFRMWIGIALAMASVSLLTILRSETAGSHMHNLRLEMASLDTFSKGAYTRRDSILPIIPKLASSNTFGNEGEAALNQFFSYFPDSRTGWIDVNARPATDIQELRRLAQKILGRKTMCGVPSKIGDEVIPESTEEYCFWEGDVVSKEALDNFSFEKPQWSFVVKAFRELSMKQRTSSTPCQQVPLGFLDIGINVGDWISPIRLLLPEIPIYGVEGSPATAAIATANLRTSVEYWKGKNRQIGPSKVVPFALAAQAQTRDIQKWGGVCFAKIQHFRAGDNIGGRHVQTGMDCPPPDAAGATTLAHALRGLTTTTSQQQSCPEPEWPSIFIAKMDVEGFEFKAISSAIEWLSVKPPCYMIIEYWNKPSYTALLELLLDVGYDSVWLPREGNTPPDSAWWSLERDGRDVLHRRAKKHWGGGYAELTVGFADTQSCLDRLQGGDPQAVLSAKSRS